ncbi:MAG: flagellar biosynthetic protein FliQ [Fimbriimonadaceae bacterium]
MNESVVVDLGRQALQVGFMVSLPILSVALFLGVAVSVFQAITQVQEATLTFVPKLIGIGAALVIMGNWMLTTIVSFTQSCLSHAANVGRL